MCLIFEAAERILIEIIYCFFMKQHPIMTELKESTKYIPDEIIKKQVRKLHLFHIVFKGIQRYDSIDISPNVIYEKD